MVEVSLSASSDSGLGQGGDLRRGRVARGGHQVRDAQGDQVRDGQEQPGQPDLARPASVLKSRAWARAWISGTSPPLGLGRRIPGRALFGHRLGEIPVPAGVPSAASVSAISSMECPAARRCSMIRGRAASLAGAVFGPGLPETKNSRAPARKSPDRRQAGGGVAEPGGGLVGGQALGEVGAQRRTGGAPGSPGGGRTLRRAVGVFADWSMLLVHHVCGQTADRSTVIRAFRHE